MSDIGDFQVRCLTEQHSHFLVNCCGFLMLEKCLLALVLLSDLVKRFQKSLLWYCLSVCCVFARYILFVSSLTAANKSSAIMSTHIVACLLLYRHRQVSLSHPLYNLLSWCLATVPYFPYFYSSFCLFFFSPCPSTSRPSCPLPHTKVIQMSHTSAW